MPKGEKTTVWQVDTLLMKQLKPVKANAANPFGKFRLKCNLQSQTKIIKQMNTDFFI
jgi:hypothetical protein